MPAIPAAFAAVAAGAGSVGAIATVVSTVGMGLSVVGKITGSKTLMKLGGVMGLVGGVTSLASSALGAANAATAAEGVVGAAEGAAGLGEAAGGWVSAEGGAAYAGGMAADAASSIPSITESLTSGLENIGQAGQDMSEASRPSFSDARFESQNSGLLNAPSTTAPVQTDISSAPQLASDGLADQQQNEMNKLMRQGNAPTDTSSGGIRDWWKNLSDRQKSAYIQAGAGAVGGLFQGWTAEQKMAFEREKMNLLTSNANAQPIVAFKKAQPTTGLLNANRGA